MKKNIFLCFLLFFVLVYFGNNRAEELDVQVNSVDVSIVENSCKIDIKLDREADYKLLELKDKKFLVFDILDSVSNLKSANQYLSNSFIKIIRSSQYQITPIKIVRLVFELQEMFPYKIEKNNSGFTIVLEKGDPETISNKVLENKEEPKAEKTNMTEGTEESGLISMDFREVDINNVLRMFSYKSGLNIVAGSEVQGKITLRLSKVPWEQALKTILEINGFTYEKTGNIIRVASVAKIKSDQKARVEEELSNLKAVESAKPLIPLNTKTIFVSYASVDEMKETLLKIISERGSIMTDKRTNSMVISDIPENIKKIEEMVAILDRRTPQVIIESKLIQIKSDDTKRLGINWGAPDGTAGGIKTINPNGRANIDVGMLPAVSGTSNITVGTVFDNFALNAALHAMLDMGTTELLASPKVCTLDNEKAIITIGKKVPIRLLDEDGRPVTRLVPVGIKLEVKPHITADNHISMQIKPEVSFIEPQPVSKGEIEINTTEAETFVMVKDSQTAVIGGLIRKDISETENKVPFLSNIPFLGFLFKNKANSDSRNELLIFVSPHIITDDEMQNDAFLGLKRMEEIDLEKSPEEIEKQNAARESKFKGRSKAKEENKVKEESK
ncbi:MAG: type IV pilus secretin PilQ [bacterium]|nr:type IV pilus secretin PilQ [bacterium]